MAAASLGLDFQVQNAINLWVAALRPPKDGRADLASIVFHEERPDLGELKKVSDEVFASIAGDVQDVLLPQANYFRMESLWLWTAWTQTQQILAKTSSISPVAAVQADSRPAIIHPALTVATGELDILFSGAEGRDIQMARFTPGKDAAAPAGTVIWKMPLPAKPLAAVAALGPVAAKSPRRLLLAFQNKQDVALHLYDLADGQQPGAPIVAPIPNASLLPNQQPALRVDDDGATHAAVLLADAATGAELSLADLLFAAKPQVAPKVQLADGRKLSAKSVAATLTYGVRPDYPMRRDWAVLLDNGSIVHSQVAAGTPPMRPFGVPFLPLQLAAMSHATYVLTQLPTGVIMEPLH